MTKKTTDADATSQKSETVVQQQDSVTTAAPVVKKSALEMTDAEFKLHETDMIAQQNNHASTNMTFEKSPMEMTPDEWLVVQSRMQQQRYKGLVRTPSQAEIDLFKSSGY